MQSISDRYHRSLAEYFKRSATQPLYLDKEKRKPNARKLVELPWQQTQAEMWDEVCGTLGDLQFVEAKCRAAMTDALLANYHEAASPDAGASGPALSAHRRFVQDNALQLRSHPSWCLQLAMLEPSDSPVGKEARGIAATSGIVCLEPFRVSAPAAERCEMRLMEHRDPVWALGFDASGGQLLSSDGEQVIRWALDSAAIDSRYSLPVQSGVESRHKRVRIDDDQTFTVNSYRWKVTIAEGVGSIAVGNVLREATAGREICVVDSGFVAGYEDGHLNELEWMAPPAVSSDSGMVAVCSKRTRHLNRPDISFSVRVASGHTGVVVADLPHLGWVKYIVFSPDSRLLATIEETGRPHYGATVIDVLRVWDIAACRDIYQLEGSFDMVTFSADGAALVVNGTTDPSQDHQILYGVSTVDWSRLFEVRHTISWTTKVSRKFTGMVFLGSATVIMWGLNLVELWNVQTGQLEGRLAFGCNGGITSCALRHDEEQCALGFKDGRIEVWSVEALRREHQGDDAQGTQSVVCGVSITPDGHRLAVCYESGSVSIVDVSTGSEIVSREVFLKKVTVDSLFFTPDSRSVIVTYQEWGNTCVRRLAAMDLTDQALFENTTWEVVLRSLSMTPDGAGILTLRKSYADVNATVHELLELRTEDLVLLRSHRIPHEPQNWALWPDGSQIVWGANMHVWSLVKEREVFSVVSPVDKAVVFPDGMSVAATKRSFGAGNEIIVVSIGQGSTMSIPEDRVVRPWGRVVQCSPDGRRLLLDDGVLIDVRSHRSMACDKSVTMIREVSYAFSSDGRRVYGLDGEFIYMWDSDSGACLTLLPLKRSGAFKWSTDGNVLVVAQGDILRVFRPVNIVQQPCIVTAVRLLDVVSKAWQRDVTVLCSRCGVRCAVPSAICDVIVSVNRSSGMSPQESPCLRLPDGAWEERGLYSECPHCHQVLRFNPFIVDNSDARRECW